MKLTKQNVANHAAYLRAVPKPFGTLHERMKYVMELMQQAKESMPQELWMAIYDLELEVSYLEPQIPPCGRRTQHGR